MSAGIQKHWFSNALDLFVRLHEEPTTEKNSFLNETTSLTKQIQELALTKFNLDSEKLQKLTEKAFKAISSVPQEGRISTLVRTKLFELVVSTRGEFLDPKDHEYFQNDIVAKMFQGYSKMNNLDLSYIQNNPEALNWICAVSETMLYPQERHDMRITMSQIPVDYYNKTQMKRMEIGKLITTRALCELVQAILSAEGLGDAVKELTVRFQLMQSNKQDDETITAIAEEIYQKFREEIIQTAPKESQEAVRLNLIVSLGIRARQLP